MPLGGGEQVDRIVPGARAARLDTSGRYPRIPAAPGSGLGRLPAELGSLPLARIAGNPQHALDELAGAARAVRSRADCLDEHPAALLRGRRRH